MNLKLYDSYLKREIEIDPNHTSTPGTVKIYSCGPTVYNYQHIGNIRATFLPSIIVDIFKIMGAKVEWSLNITDVGHLVSDGDQGEDKIEKGAKREGKSVQEIVKHYTEDFVKQAKAINIDLPQGNFNPIATDYIKEQAILALELLIQEKAYMMEDGIYLDFERVKKGLSDKMSHNQILKNILATIENESKGNDSSYTGRKTQGDKNAPQDFAIWKFVPENTIQKWQFSQYPESEEILGGKYAIILDKWGVPGWHSECVCMICATLGTVGFTSKAIKDYESQKAVIDIHTGGEDHIDIHHRNEILQSSALGFNLSKYWVHNKFVMVDGGKMSKSLGNVYLVTGDKEVTGFESIESKGYNPLAYRLMLLEHNYSQQMNFTWKKLEASAARLGHMKKNAAAVRFGNQLNYKSAFKAEGEILITLLNNLNTTKAIEIVQNNLNTICDLTQRGEVDDISRIQTLEEWDRLFFKLELFPEIPDEINRLQKLRDEARANKDWSKSDELRDQIKAQGWHVDDYSNYSALWKVS